MNAWDEELHRENLDDRPVMPKQIGRSILKKQGSYWGRESKAAEHRSTWRERYIRLELIYINHFFKHLHIWLNWFIYITLNMHTCGRKVRYDETTYCQGLFISKMRWEGTEFLGIVWKTREHSTDELITTRCWERVCVCHAICALPSTTLPLNRFVGPTDETIGECSRTFPIWMSSWMTQFTNQRKESRIEQADEFTCILSIDWKSRFQFNLMFIDNLNEVVNQYQT